MLQSRTHLSWHLEYQIASICTFQIVNQVRSTFLISYHEKRIKIETNIKKFNKVITTEKSPGSKEILYNHLIMLFCIEVASTDAHKNIIDS